METRVYSYTFPLALPQKDSVSCVVVILPFTIVCLKHRHICSCIISFTPNLPPPHLFPPSCLPSSLPSPPLPLPYPPLSPPSPPLHFLLSLFPFSRWKMSSRRKNRRNWRRCTPVGSRVVAMTALTVGGEVQSSRFEMPLGRAPWRTSLQSGLPSRVSLRPSLPGRHPPGVRGRSSNPRCRTGVTGAIHIAYRELFCC